jgi:hypothetical protein
MITFQNALYQQLQALPAWSDVHASLARQIEQAPAGQTSPAAGVLEQAVIVQLGLAPGSVIDWTSQEGRILPGKTVVLVISSGKPAPTETAIDWAGILAFIEELLPIIMPFLSAA